MSPHFEAETVIQAALSGKRGVLHQVTCYQQLTLVLLESVDFLSLILQQLHYNRPEESFLVKENLAEMTVLELGQVDLGFTQPNLTSY